MKREDFPTGCQALITYIQTCCEFSKPTIILLQHYTGVENVSTGKKSLAYMSRLFIKTNSG